MLLQGLRTVWCALFTGSSAHEGSASGEADAQWLTLDTRADALRRPACQPANPHTCTRIPTDSAIDSPMTHVADNMQPRSPSREFPPRAAQSGFFGSINSVLFASGAVLWSKAIMKSVARTSCCQVYAMSFCAPVLFATVHKPAKGVDLLVRCKVRCKVRCGMDGRRLASAVRCLESALCIQRTCQARDVTSALRTHEHAETTLAL